MARQAPKTIIIGGGHNGLVCAFYLARAGHKVTILERRGVIGGAAVTEEFHPGFRNSTASYTVSLLNPRIIDDMALHAHGLRIVERPIANFLPSQDGRYLKLGPTLARSQAEIAKFSQADADAFPRYTAMLDQIGDVLRRMAMQTPPNLGDGIAGLPRALLQGNALRRLGLPQQRDLLDLFTKSARDVLDGWFESDEIKALLGFDSIVGNYASPETPGSAYVLLHHTFGGVNGKTGNWGHAIGGMGAITQAMARACTQAGVDIHLNSPVRQVLVQNKRATGVLLHSGEEIPAATIVSNLNPKLLFQHLVPQSELDADFKRRITGYKNASGTFRMNVALSELPDFTCLPGRAAADHHASGIIIGPTLAYMDRAYLDARTFGWGARTDHRNAHPLHAGRHARATRPARRQPVLPARRPHAPQSRLGVRARGSGRCHDRRRDQTRPQFPRLHPRPRQPLARGSGGKIRPYRRRHHAWQYVARSALGLPADPRTRFVQVPNT